MTPMFTVIIPSYNRGHLIAKTIQSVLDQNLPDWELIVVDDGSTDNTKEVVQGIGDDRIRYVYQENAERSAARNNGVKNAKGQWICFLDSDDYYLPNHLEVFASFIEKNNPEPSFLSAGRLVESNGQTTKVPLYNPESKVHPAQHIFKNATITPINVCIHKACFEKHLFLEKFKKSYWEDTHLWIRMAISFPFHQLKEYTNVLTQHDDRSISSNFPLTRVTDHIEMIKNLFEKNEELLTPFLNNEDKRNHIDRKYRAFLYRARQGGQLRLSIKIWRRAISFRFSFYLVSEFPKIFLNKMGLGIRK